MMTMSEMVRCRTLSSSSSSIICKKKRTNGITMTMMTMTKSNNNNKNKPLLLQKMEIDDDGAHHHCTKKTTTTTTAQNKPSSSSLLLPLPLEPIQFKPHPLMEDLDNPNVPSDFCSGGDRLGRSLAIQRWEQDMAEFDRKLLTMKNTGSSSSDMMTMTMMDEEEKPMMRMSSSYCHYYYYFVKRTNPSISQGILRYRSSQNLVNNLRKDENDDAATGGLPPPPYTTPIRMPLCHVEFTLKVARATAVHFAEPNISSLHHHHQRVAISDTIRVVRFLRKDAPNSLLSSFNSSSMMMMEDHKDLSPRELSMRPIAARVMDLMLAYGDSPIAAKTVAPDDEPALKQRQRYLYSKLRALDPETYRMTWKASESEEQKIAALVKAHDLTTQDSVDGFFLNSCIDKHFNVWRSVNLLPPAADAGSPPGQEEDQASIMIMRAEFIRILISLIEYMADALQCRTQELKDAAKAKDLFSLNQPCNKAMLRTRSLPIKTPDDDADWMEAATDRIPDAVLEPFHSARITSITGVDANDATVRSALAALEAAKRAAAAMGAVF